MKAKRIIKLVSLTMVGLFGFLISLSLSAHASSSSVTSVMTTLPTSNTAYYSLQTTGNTLGLNLNDGLIAYPKLGAVKANYANEGRLSTQTTSISIVMSGTISFKTTATIKSLYYDVMTYDPKNDKTGSGVSLISDTSKYVNMATGSSTSVTLSSLKTATIPVNLANLKTNLPIYIGFRITIADGEVVTYQLSNFNSVAPKTTIDAPISTDTQITGTGIAGNIVTTTINGQVYTATIGSDGKYVIKLNDNLSGVSSVTVTQTGDAGYGEVGTATADVTVAPLAIKSDKTALDISSADLSTMTSDSDVVTWLVKQANIVATNPSNATDMMTYSASESNILTTVQGLAPNASTTINVLAKSASGLTSPSVAITVTKQGTLSFGTFTDVTFGDLTIPSSEQLYAPTNSWNATVDDTRTAGSTWSVSVSATPMTSTTTSGRTLTGDLVYKDGSTQTILTNASKTIMTGTKVSGTDTTNLTSDWSGTTKGILLDVRTGVYADTYSGKVNWTLSDTATN